MESAQQTEVAETVAQELQPPLENHPNAKQTVAVGFLPAKLFRL